MRDASPSAAPRRVRPGWFFLLVPLIAGQLIAGAARAELPDYVPHQHLRDDASLRGVYFVDPDRGWAVGDRGVILHTETGGDSWSFQDSGTTDNLSDIAAADAQHAIAVGGGYEPETQLSRGVVLTTRDGGRSWQQVETDLPRLRSVRLDRSGQAIAVGDFSGLHLTSAFTSRDGGRSWQPIVDASLGSMADATGEPGRSISFLDHRGLLLHQLRPGARPVAVHGDRRLRRIAGDGALRVAVGDAETTLISRDAGRSWSALSLSLSQPATDGHVAPLTLQAACEAAGTLWVAGVPGNRIWRIPAEGPAEASQLPLPAPLHDLFFLDGQRGWGVGAFGAILATRDGGRSWRFQQAAPRRAALLVVAEDAAALPWPVLASESLEMGRRTAVVLRPQASAAADPLAAPTTAVVAQAASQMGGGEVLCWQMVDADDAQQQGSDAAVAHQALEAYRPTVLLISGTLPADVRQQWIQAAMQRNIGRVLETSRGTSSELTLHASAVLPRVGVITGDLWRDAVAIACPGTPTPDKLFLRRAYDSILSLQGGRVDGLFAGLPVGDVASTRELAPPASRRHLQILAARANERAIIERMLAEGDDRGSYLARLELMVNQTPADNRQRLLRSILIRCREKQAAQRYRQTLAVAAAQLGDAPLGRLATLRLAAIDRSQEWGRLHLAVAQHASVAGAAPVAAAPVRLSPFEASEAPLPAVQMAAAIEMTPDLRPIHRAAPPATRTLAAASKQPELHLAWDFDPRVLIVRGAAAPRDTAAGVDASGSGDSAAIDAAAAAAGALATDAAADGSDPQRASPHLQRLLGAPAAAAWLTLSGLRPDAAFELPVARTLQRPLLDGKCDEPCWTQAAVWKTAAGFEVRLAYDAGYVYWSASGPLLAALSPDGIPGGRQRDADLSDQLRVGLHLDVDGDLTTAYALEVNAQGQTCDTCDGFPQWQPMWFVATDHTAQRWTVEAAVRRSDLQPLPLMAGNRWRARFDVWHPHQQPPMDVLPAADDWQVITFQ